MLLQYDTLSSRHRLAPLTAVAHQVASVDVGSHSSAWNSCKILEHLGLDAARVEKVKGSNPEQCSRGFLRLASISCGSKLTGVGYDSLYFSVITVLLNILNRGV
jgi:hypothetical protein